MKEEYLRQFAVKDIHLLEPVVCGNRITYAWTENPLLDEQGCWIQFPDVSSINGSPHDLIAPCLVFALAFAALGPVRVHLPARLDDATFGAWRRMIEEAICVVYQSFRHAGPEKFSLENGSKPLARHKWRGNKTALLFGGGTESLLSLASLMDEGVFPILAGFGGPAWNGSDPERNPQKFSLEYSLANEFGLKRLRVHTNLFEVIYRPEWDWGEYMRPDIPGVMKAVLHLPFMVAALMPVAEQMELGRIASGNEQENECAETWCFSRSAVVRIGALGYEAAYASYHHDLTKFQITERLHLRYPELAKYQFSCLGNSGERWCLQCPKCFKAYVLLKIIGVDPARVGFDKDSVERNMPGMLRVVQKVAARPTHRDEYLSMRNEALRRRSSEAVQLLNQVLDGYWRRRARLIAASQIQGAKRWARQHMPMIVQRAKTAP